ncbi:DNA ligase 4 [Strongyloides ratti]|uniref:DNA ligase IV n=1 Tax=Strongyloides ratti TaxID=34506 RepID=A0A090MYJ3_STRRB|nr:DNA ligase 4 [Strongyloides ratti]CEF67284.1 DNA ligase 4 [Strongyloides ratti]
MKASTADCFSFFDFCLLLEDISLNNDNKIKENIFQEFLMRWFEQKQENHTIYPILRLMAKRNDSDNCFIFEYSCLKNIIDKDSKLKKTEYVKINESSLLAKINLLVSKYKAKNEQSGLSVNFINQKLDDLSQTNNAKNIITTLLRTMNNLERKWFLLILLSEVENITNMNFFLLFHLINPFLGQLLDDGYHPQDLLYHYNPKTFSKETFKNFLKSIEIGKPFFPMKLNVIGPKINHFLAIKKFCNGKLLAEKYYHGNHIIMHRYSNGKYYKFFSDTMDDYTEFYQNCNYNFSQEIEPLFKKNVENVILEGQMLMLYRDSKEIIEKFDNFPVGTLYDTRFMHSKDPHVKLCFQISDILYYNNNNLFHFPLEKRLKILNENIFDNIEEENIMISKQTEVKTYEEFFEFLNNSIICMQEGFVLRDSASYYISGKVPIYHCCFKIKPNYNKFVTLTMAIVGAEYFTSKESKIKHFLLAARDSNDKLTICLKVNPTTKSTTYDMLIDLLYITRSYYIKLPIWLKSKLPSMPYSRYIFQNHIVIVEVKWTKVNQGANELIYISKIINTKEKNIISLLSDVEYFKKKFDKRLNSIEIIPKTLNNLYIDNLNSKKNFHQVKDLDSWKYFKELTICVLNSSQNCSIKKAQKFLYFLGAFIVVHPTKYINFIIATDSLNIKTAAALKTKFCPILDISWIERCINGKKLEKIDMQNDIILAYGKNEFSLQNINLLIEEKNIPNDIFNNIFL